MRWCCLVILLLLPREILALEVTDANLGVTLTAPEGWTEKDGALRPPGTALLDAWSPQSDGPLSEEQRSLRMRKLHITSVNQDAKSLEDAVYAEIERIEEVSKERKRSAGTNGLQGFVGTIPFRTDSGIEGTCALFVSKGRDDSHYAINKYYFRHRNGQIFKVCAHVYGAHAQADEFDAVIRQGLHYTDAAK